MQVKCVMKGCVGSQSGTSSRTGNAWQTDEYLVTIPGQYPKNIVFEVRGVERCKQWKEFVEGMPDKNAPGLIQFEIDARETEKDGKKRWYNSVQAWDIQITTW